MSAAARSHASPSTREKAPMHPFPRPIVAAVLVLVLSAFPAHPAAGQDPAAVRTEAPHAPRSDSASLTLIDAARRALEGHPSVAEVRARVRAAEAQVGEARSERFPGIRVSGSATRYQEPMVVTPIHGFTPGQTPPFDRTLLQGSAAVTYTLWDGGGRGSRIAASREGASAARSGGAEAEQALLARTASVYLEVLGLAGTLRAHDRRIRALEAELDRVEELREVGRAARVDRLRVESALAGAEAQRVDVEADLRLAEAELARLVGAPATDVEARRLSEPGRPLEPPPTPDSLRARARSSSPAVDRARREVEATEAQVSVARSARWPRVELGGRLLHWGSDADPAAATEWNAGLQVSVPVFTGGAVGSRIERAEAERDAARERLRQRRLEAEREVDAALSAHRRSEARRRSLEVRVRSLEEVARIEALRLETGTGTQNEYLDAEAALLEARARLARTRYAALAARVRLARAWGVLTLDWLERTLGDDS